MFRFKALHSHISKNLNNGLVFVDIFMSINNNIIYGSKQRAHKTFIFNENVGECSEHSPLHFSDFLRDLDAIAHKFKDILIEWDIVIWGKVLKQGLKCMLNLVLELGDISLSFREMSQWVPDLVYSHLSSLLLLFNEIQFLDTLVSKGLHKLDQDVIMLAKGFMIVSDDFSDDVKELVRFDFGHIFDELLHNINDERLQSGYVILILENDGEWVYCLEGYRGYIFLGVSLLDQETQMSLEVLGKLGVLEEGFWVVRKQETHSSLDNAIWLFEEIFLIFNEKLLKHDHEVTSSWDSVAHNWQYKETGFDSDFSMSAADEVWFSMIHKNLIFCLNFLDFIIEEGIFYDVDCHHNNKRQGTINLITDNFKELSGLSFSCLRFLFVTCVSWEKNKLFRLFFKQSIFIFTCLHEEEANINNKLSLKVTECVIKVLMEACQFQEWQALNKQFMERWDF